MRHGLGAWVIASGENVHSRNPCVFVSRRRAQAEILAFQGSALVMTARANGPPGVAAHSHERRDDGEAKPGYRYEHLPRVMGLTTYEHATRTFELWRYRVAKSL